MVMGLTSLFPRSRLTLHILAAIAAVAPQARVVRGDRFASVATGLGLHARRVFEGVPAA